MFESLETRRLFSVTAADVHDTLYVWGDAGNNGISVQKSGVHLVVKEYQGAAGYQTVFQVLAAAVDRVRVYGYDGADTISINDNMKKPTVVMGGKGADWLKAGGGTTELWGQGNWTTDPSNSHKPSTDDSAADTFVSGKGKSFMYGQNGDDSFVFNQLWKAGVEDIAYGGNGEDTFNLNGTRHIVAIGDQDDDTFLVGASNPSAFINGTDGDDTVDYLNFGVGVFVKNNGTTMSGPRFDLDERKQRIGTDTEIIRGTPFKDSMGNMDTSVKLRLYGRGDIDNLYGGDGNDFIDGGTGSDYIYGRAGNDTIFGQAGDDSITGDNGNDSIRGHSGKDSLYGGSGKDSLFGGDDDDLLKGGSNNDQLFGDAGGDHLHGEGGANLLVGGAGSDYLVSKNGSFSDTLFGNNVDGSGGSGAFDIALIDRVFIGGVFVQDTTIGVESVSS